MWTAPRTWVTSELVTSSIMNTHVRDDLLSLDHLLGHENTDLTVASSAAATEIFGVTIPANALGTKGYVSMRVEGDYVFNRSLADTLTVIVHWNGVQVLSGAQNGISDPLSGASFGFEVEVHLWNRGGGANAQWITYGWETHEGGKGGSGAVAAAVDTTAARDLDVLVQWSFASAANSITRRTARALLGQN